MFVTNDLQTTFHMLFHMESSNGKNKTGAEVKFRIGCLQIISKYWKIRSNCLF